jgi:hypothetical protein
MIQILALEGETAISQLQFIDHNYMWHLVAKDISECMKQNDSKHLQKSKNKIA